MRATNQPKVTLLHKTETLAGLFPYIKDAGIIKPMLKANVSFCYRWHELLCISYVSETIYSCEKVHLVWQIIDKRTSYKI